MPGIAGKSNRLKVSPTAGGAGVYTSVAGLKTTSISIDGVAVDDSEFGVLWAQVLQGLKSAKITAAGNYRGTDANGQVAILSAFLNDSELWAQLLPDNAGTGGIGFKAQVVVTKFQLDAAVDGSQPISLEMDTTGVVTQI